jgi:hydrogenase expression/formation protein HypC
MKITGINGSEAIVMAGGLKKKADISLIAGAKIGDYVLIHAGFAIEKVKVSEAKKTLRALKEVSALR